MSFLPAQTDDMAIVEIARLTRAESPELDESTVIKYMENHDHIDPVLVYEDPRTGELTLANGNHRVEAASRLNLTVIQATIVRGTRHEATAYCDLR
jgi:hypothetical protein